MPEPTARAHARRIAAFVDYLIATVRVPVLACSVVDICRYLYRVWPQSNDSIREAAGVIEALELFFAFLDGTRDLSVAGLLHVVANAPGMGQACMVCPRTALSDPAMIAWLNKMDHELEADYLVPPVNTNDERGVRWEDTVGPRRNALWHELSRRWIAWHDEAIRAGMIIGYQIDDALSVCRQRWEQAPRPQDGGLTPVEIVAREQQQMFA